MEWLSPQTIVSFLALAAGLITAIVAWRKENRQGPIDAVSTKVNQANSITEVSMGMLDRINEKYNMLSNRVDILEDIARGWDIWYHNLVTRWDEHRQNIDPPPPPKTVV